MLDERELRAVNLLQQLVVDHWVKFREPYSLSDAGVAFLRAKVPYPSRSNSKRLKDFVLRTENQGLYRLVEHPKLNHYKGIVPADAEFDILSWISPSDQLPLGVEESHEIVRVPGATSKADGTNDEDKQSFLSPAPVDGVPSAFGYAWSTERTLVLESSSANVPHFPFPSSERDHSQRLQTCRTLASDLIREVSASQVNIRPEYKLELSKYEDRLPSESEGNIILADAAARTLRSLFAAEVNILPTAFAASLKTLLEQHVGLRPYYAELEALYRDVRSGRLEEPLPLDAVDGVVKTIREHTPEVFDRSVAAAIDESTVPPPLLQVDLETPPTENQPTPPPDPMGEVDLTHAHDYQVAGVINRLWQVFMLGEKLRKAGMAWRETYEAMAPSVSKILEWLHSFVLR